MGFLFCWFLVFRVRFAGAPSTIVRRLPIGGLRGLLLPSNVFGGAVVGPFRVGVRRPFNERIAFHVYYGCEDRTADLRPAECVRPAVPVFRLVHISYPGLALS